jgi:hypothetical protein
MPDLFASQTAAVTDRRGVTAVPQGIGGTVEPLQWLVMSGENGKFQWGNG